MTGGALGGGVLFAVLALLWIAVLAPSWMKKREFNVAEQNAARLQRTLRILAETSELPEEHRVEASAQQALAHEKMLKIARKRQLAERNAVLEQLRADQVLAQQEEALARKRKEAAMKSIALAGARIRKARIAAFTVGLIGLLGLIVGVVLAAMGLGGTVLLWSAVASVVGIGTLVTLAPGRVKKRTSPANPTEEREQRSTPNVETVPQAPEQTDHSAAAHAQQQARAAERLNRARQLARAREEARRAAESPRENQPDSMLLKEAGEARPAAQQASAKRGSTSNASERLRRMGVVGDTSDGMVDLDAALRRRRSAS